MTPMFAPDEFWEFAADQYGLDGVKERCLALQNGHSVDINLLLLCHWLDCQQLVIAENTLRELVRISDHWQKSRLAPLRAKRTAMKKTDTSYQAALARELAEERNEQRALIACLNQPSALESGRSFSCPVNLIAYAAQKPFPLDEVQTWATQQRG